MLLMNCFPLIPPVKRSLGLLSIISFVVGFSLLYAFPTVGAERFPETAFGETIHGTLDDQDLPYQGRLFDTYTFEGIEGQEIFFNLSSSEFDAFLWLLNDKGEVIAIDDDTGDTMGALISRFSLPYTGTYLVAVGSHDAGETGAYTLSLNEAPWVGYSGEPEEIFIGEQVSGRLTHSSSQFLTGQFFNAYRFEASPGQAVSIEMHSERFDSYLWLLDSHGRVITVNDEGSGQSTAGSSKIVFFPPISGSYFIGVSSSEPMAVGEYELVLKTTFQPIQEAEAFSETVSGHLEAFDFQLSTGQYLDVYTLEGEVGERITIGLSSSGFDSYLRVLDSAGNVLKEDDDSGVESDALIAHFVLPESGHYYVWVSSVFAGETGDYVLSLNEPLPSLRSRLDIRTEENLNLLLGKKNKGGGFIEQDKTFLRKGQPFTDANRCVGDTTPYTAKVKICIGKRKESLSSTVTVSGPEGIVISQQNEDPEDEDPEDQDSKTSMDFTVSPDDCVTVGTFSIVSANAKAGVKTITATVPELGSDSEDMRVLALNDEHKEAIQGSSHEIKANVSYNYSPIINAQTEEGITDQLGEPYYGKTDTVLEEPSYNYSEPSFTELTCGYKAEISFEVAEFPSLNITITIPQHSSPPSGTLGDKWNTFISNLDTHEKEHVAINEQSSSKMATLFNGGKAIGIGATEKRAEELALEAMKEASDAIFKEHDQNQENHDIETQHGVTEGAVWPQP